ncbi:MAG: PilZ domain-containing protein [Deltaproteobacteria bacterium]|nr:MAG: PilZ domain-containing protein [Deltaproteobacteria bacterium]
MFSDFIRLDYSDKAFLARCLVDREKGLLFYPAVGRIKLGDVMNVDVNVSDLNATIRLKVAVVGRRTKPRGAKAPRGVYLEVLDEDRHRYLRLCQIADGMWTPGRARRHPRLSCNFKASYYVPPSFYPGTVKDISKEGLFIHTDGPLVEPGRGVFVQLHTGTFGKRLKLDARVCWTDRVDSRRGMGLNCFGPAGQLKRMGKLVERLIKRQTVQVSKADI